MNLWNDNFNKSLNPPQPLSTCSGHVIEQWASDGGITKHRGTNSNDNTNYYIIIYQPNQDILGWPKLGLS